jgi:hypothetical protein
LPPHESPPHHRPGKIELHANLDGFTLQNATLPSSTRFPPCRADAAPHRMTTRFVPPKILGHAETFVVWPLVRALNDTTSPGLPHHHLCRVFRHPANVRNDWYVREFGLTIVSAAQTAAVRITTETPFEFGARFVAHDGPLSPETAEQLHAEFATVTADQLRALVTA